MKKEIATRWIEELRSGKHIQGKSALVTHSGAKCCLGVLACDVLGLSEEQARMSYLPDESVYAAGMQSNTGTFSVKGKTHILADINDLHDKTFPEIADIIEQNWERL